MAITLSKNEYKYRYKYFYENHLNKYMQSKVDKLVANDSKIGTYKKLYLSYRDDNPLVFLISCDLASRSLDEISNAFKELNENTISFEQAINCFRRSALKSAI